MDEDFDVLTKDREGLPVGDTAELAAADVLVAWAAFDLDERPGAPDFFGVRSVSMIEIGLYIP